MSREIPVKLSRVITLFGIVSASIIALAILVICVLISLSALDAIGWHLRHGNKVAFDGHTFHVPFMWTSASDPYSKALDIEREYQGGLIQLTSTGQVLDPAAARAWQANTIAAYHRPDRISVFKESGIVIQGKNLEFVCISTYDNIDLKLSMLSAPKHQNEVQSILDNSK